MTEHWSKFKKLVLKLIKSGEETLDGDKIKEVKGLCKAGLLDMLDVFDFLMKHLQTSHAQIRLSTVQVLHELILRSQVVRELTWERLQSIVSLTLALEAGENLPPPTSSHKLLTETAIRSIDLWHEKFGQFYPKLRVSYRFLQTKRNVDFKELIARSDLEEQNERRRREEEKRAADFLVERRLQAFEGQRDAFKDCLFECKTCFDLLSPFLSSTDKDLGEVDVKSPSTNAMPPLPSSSAADNTLTPNEIHKVSPRGNGVLKESPDNASIIQTLEDRIRQIKKGYLQKLDNWLSEMVRNGAEQKQVLPILRTKEKLVGVLTRWEAIEVIRSGKRKRRFVYRHPDDENDDDFEEVNDEEVLAGIPEQDRMAVAMKLSSKKGKEKAVKGPKRDDSSSSSKPPSLKKKATKRNPIIPPKSQKEKDEEDLALHKQSLLRFESCHRFWATKEFDAEDLDMETVRALNPSYTEVEGVFEPVKWKCRAPMGEGKLCPRMDRVKCPLHGKVIPRDPNTGAPMDGTTEKCTKQKRLHWKEMEIGGESKRKKSKLVSVSKVKQPATAKGRLEKRLAKSAFHVDKNSEEDGFDQQFNYVVSLK